MFPFLLPLEPSVVLTAPAVSVYEESENSDVGFTIDNPPLRSTDRYGVLVTPTGLRVPLTGDDVLWTARMLHGEAGRYDDQQAVVWTLAQRFYWGAGGGERPNPGAYAGFAHAGGWTPYIRGFSQAINPEWYAGGSHCPLGRTTGGCTPQLTAKRAALARKPWADLDESARRVALAFATGNLPNNAPGVINFNDGSPYAAPVASLGFPTGNTFYYSAGATSRDWGGAGMGIAPPAPASGVGQFLLALVPGAQELSERIH